MSRDESTMVSLQQYPEFDEVVESQERARELLAELGPEEKMLEVKPTGTGFGTGGVDTVRAFDGHGDEVQVRPSIGGAPIWLDIETATEEMIGHPVRLVDYEGVA